MSDKATRTFDAALEELEATVKKLDAGELPLEEALAVYERGVGLVRECQELLDEAERRITELTETAQGISEVQRNSGDS
jgi:exodeoxyribonuclease VII small subunit